MNMDSLWSLMDFLFVGAGFYMIYSWYLLKTKGEIKADLVFRYALNANGDGTTSIDMCVEGGDEYYFEVPEMTDGMIENTLLAICATLMLGGREEQIAQRLETLKPLPMRGGIVETDRAKYYLDCYNASPTSMKDALAHFEKISANAAKRTYVLGTMAELGLASHPHHKDIGSHITPISDDTAILVGAFADAYKAGLISNGWDEKNIFVFENAQAAREKIAEAGGFVFVKGSRVCGLENALPDDVLQKLSDKSAEPAQEEETPDPEETPAEAPKSEDGEDDSDEFENDEDGGFEDEDDSDDNAPEDEDERDTF